jgi:hypothetical protein
MSRTDPQDGVQDRCSGTYPHSHSLDHPSSANPHPIAPCLLPPTQWIQLSSWVFFTIWATTTAAVHGGMTLLPGFGYIPKPYELWPTHNQRLYHFGTACLVVAWSAYDR